MDKGTSAAPVTMTANIDDVWAFVRDFQSRRMGLPSVRVGAGVVTRLPELLGISGLYTDSHLRALPSQARLCGVPIVIDPDMPAGWIQMRNWDGQRIWVDCRTDEEKAKAAL